MSKREKQVEVSPLAVAKQKEIAQEIKQKNTAQDAPVYYKVDTYGCQQNVADSETICGYLRDMGYLPTEDECLADVIVFNTCTVRESAENKVWGHLGLLQHSKKKKPSQIIALCGCMAAREENQMRIQSSFPHVDLVFSPDSLWKLPELLQEVMQKGTRLFVAADAHGVIAEDLPKERVEGPAAWLSIMYGCNNFCSYCIVPHVRGRERSRAPEKILEDVSRLVAEGVKDITLLGQNVNSYGSDLEKNIDFSWLLMQINALEGDFRIRFMTSHPKDAGERLFATMAKCEKVAKHIHLPVQAGNTRVLRAMNRGYTKEEYLERIDIARRYMPEIVITGDIIVGFPSETEPEFYDTLDVLEQVRFDALFTFIFSPREGTPAAEMADPISREEKQVWFDQLLRLQNRISSEKHAAYIGQTQRVLVEGLDADGNLKTRTDGGRLVRVIGDAAKIGEFVDVKVTSAATWALEGELL